MLLLHICRESAFGKKDVKRLIWYHKWVEAGLPVYYKPVLVNAENEEDSFYWAYVKDPDGITLELNQKLHPRI